MLLFLNLMNNVLNNTKLNTNIKTSNVICNFTKFIASMNGKNDLLAIIIIRKIFHSSMPWI